MESTSPVVLISGGVGLTPMMCMLNSIVHDQPERNVYFIHAAMNGKVHAFKDYVKDLTSKHKQAESYVVYQSPDEEDRKAGNYDKEGYLDLEFLQKVLPSKDASFYFCGPPPFMKAVNAALKKWGVPEEYIHYEFFGAFGDLEG